MDRSQTNDNEGSRAGERRGVGPMSQFPFWEMGPGCWFFAIYVAQLTMIEHRPLMVWSGFTDSISLAALNASLSHPLTLVGALASRQTGKSSAVEAVLTNITNSVDMNFDVDVSYKDESHFSHLSDCVVLYPILAPAALIRAGWTLTDLSVHVACVDSHIHDSRLSRH